jgi:hypothetical protein
VMVMSLSPEPTCSSAQFCFQRAVINNDTEVNSSQLQAALSKVINISEQYALNICFWECRRDRP